MWNVAKWNSSAGADRSRNIAGAASLGASAVAADTVNTEAGQAGTGLTAGLTCDQQAGGTDADGSLRAPEPGRSRSLGGSAGAVDTVGPGGAAQSAASLIVGAANRAHACRVAAVLLSSAGAAHLGAGCLRPAAQLRGRLSTEETSVSADKSAREGLEHPAARRARGQSPGDLVESMTVQGSPSRYHRHRQCPQSVHISSQTYVPMPEGASTED